MREFSSKEGDLEMSLNRNSRNQSGQKKPPLIYLAGPEVFLPNAAEIGRHKKYLCAEYGFEGVFPIDVELDVRDKSRREAGLVISAANEGLIRRCDLLIANITPFRGPSADVGTAYEMGFARGIGLMVCAYTNTSAPFTERTEKSSSHVSRDANGVLKDENGMTVEEWGLVDNLMLDGSIEAGGGILVVENVLKEKFTFLGGFEKCLKFARKVMLLKRTSEE